MRVTLVALLKSLAVYIFYTYILGDFNAGVGILFEVKIMKLGYFQMPCYIFFTCFHDIVFDMTDFEIFILIIFFVLHVSLKVFSHTMIVIKHIKYR